MRPHRRLRSARLAQEAEGASDRLENLGYMDIPKQQEQSAEERIGTMVGKIMVLTLIAFFVWAYGSTLAAKLALF
jgi:hypothetical protein